jgi:hypothetical protein
MSDALIRTAFESRLATWAAAQSPAIPVAYENCDFTPPAGRYVRCFILPANTQSETLDGIHRKRTGIFQVDLCMPIKSGSGAAIALAASLDAAFPLTAPMTQSTLKIFLLSPMSMAAAIQQPDHFVVPVSCAYRADTV